MIPFCVKKTEAQFSFDLPTLKVDLLTPILAEVRKFFPDSDDVVDMFVGLSSQLLIAMRNLQDPVTVACCATTVISVLGLSSSAGHLITSMFSKIYEMLKNTAKDFKARSKTRAHADIESDEYAELAKQFQEFNITGVVASLGGIAFALLVGLTLKKLPGKGTIDELMMRVKHLPGTMEGAFNIQQFGTKATTYVVEAFRKYVLGYTEESFNAFASVGEWMTEVRELVRLENVIKIRADADVQARADRCYQRGLLIAAEYDALKYPMKKQETFRYYMMAASRIRDLAHNSGAGFLKPRIEPVVVHLFGGSGVGKSAITNAVCADILRVKGVRSQKEFNNLVYYRKTTNEFWDGITSNHKIVVYDDWAQVKDQPGKPNPEFMELIYAGNNAPYSLHMAELSAKATTFMHAEAIILTSNNDSYTMESLTHPEAVRRRLDVRALMTVRPECGRVARENGKEVIRIDAEKCKGKPFTYPYLFSIARKGHFASPLKQSDFITPEPMEYDEFIKIVLDEYQVKLDRSVDLISNIAEYISREDPVPTEAHSDEPDKGPITLSEEAIRTREILQKRKDAKQSGSSSDVSDSGLSDDPSTSNSNDGEPIVLQDTANTPDIPPIDVTEDAGIIYLDRPTDVTMRRVRPTQMHEVLRGDDFMFSRRDAVANGYQRKFEYYVRNRSEAAVMNLREFCTKASRNVLTGPKLFFFHFMGFFFQFNLFNKLRNFLGHTSANPLRFHVDVRDHYEMPIPSILDVGEEGVLPPPGLYRMIAELRYAECFSVKKHESAFSFVYAHHVAKYYAENCRGNDDPVDTFVRVYWLLLPDTIKVEAMINMPIPCARNCLTYLQQLMQNIRFTTIDNPFAQMRHEWPEELNVIYDTMPEEAYEFTKVIVSALSLLVTLISAAFGFYYLKQLIVNVRNFIKKIIGVVQPTTIDVDCSARSEGVYPSGTPSSAPVKTVQETSPYPTGTPSSPPAKALVESWGNYTTELRKGNREEVFVKIDAAPPGLRAKVADVGYFTPVREIYSKTSDCIDATSIPVEGEMAFLTPVKKYFFPDRESPLASGASSVPLAEQPLEQGDLSPDQVVVGKPAQVQDPIVQSVSSAIKRVAGQAAVDENAITLYSKLIAGSIYKMEVKDSNGDWRHLMNIIFVCGRIAVVNKHALYSLRNRDFIRIRNPSCTDGAIISTNDLVFATIDESAADVKYKYRDVALLSFPRIIRQHADITTHFVTNEDIRRFSDIKKAALIGFIPNKSIIARVYVTKDVRSSDRLLDMGESLGFAENTVLIRDHYEYNIETSPGECGMVLISMNPGHNRKIVGIHCSGQPDLAYQGNATPVSQEMLSAMLRKLVEHGITMDTVVSLPECGLRKTVAHCLPVPDTRCEAYEILIESNGAHFCPLGYIADPVFSGSRTSITPSPIGESIVENKRAPARLRPFFGKDGKWIDPMKLAMKKADIAPTYVSNELLMACVEDLYSLLDKPTERDLGPLNLDKAIQGVDGDPWLSGISRKSSPGYPWIHKRSVGRGKEQWLGSCEDWVLHEEFSAIYSKRIALAKQGLRMPTYWVDTLKDELRPLSRVEAGKTRLFSVGEMTFNVAIRQYFLPVVAHLMENRVGFETCVGVNPYSSDWAAIATRMMSKGRNIIAGDFSNFDGSLLGDFLWACFDIMTSLTKADEEVRMIMTTLFSEIAHSVHLNHNFVYTWNHSQPSGNPLTVILNSLINSLGVRYAWLLVTKGTKYFGLKAFHEHVATVNYGDDNLINITEEALPFFNMASITAAFAEFGFTYTDEHKSTEIFLARRLEEVSFLKRQFVFDRELFRWKAPLSLDTVLEMAQWVRGKDDPDSVCAQTMEMAVYELAQHDHETFDKYMPLFKMAAKLLRGSYKPCFETYAIYQEMDNRKYYLIPAFQ